MLAVVGLEMTTEGARDWYRYGEIEGESSSSIMQSYTQEMAIVS